MRQFLVLFIVCIYGLGNVVFPNTDVAHLHEMYSQCEMEDPDINIVDFVFEHILNLPDVFEGLENEEEGPTEKHHEPTYVVSQGQSAGVVTSPISFDCNITVSFYPVLVHKSCLAQHFPAGFTAKILRPPIV